MAKLVLLKEDGSSDEIALDKERLTLGRRADNDVCLPDTAVSGEHAQVVTLLADSFLEDLGSTNGTAVFAAMGAEGGVVLDQPYARPHEVQAEQQFNPKGPRHDLDAVAVRHISMRPVEAHEFRSGKRQNQNRSDNHSASQASALPHVSHLAASE